MTRTETEETEQHLLDAIHAHPQKRDLVMNLLRQIEQETSLTRRQQHSNPSTETKSHENDPNMDSDDSI